MAIRRDSGERTLPWGLVLPRGEDMLTAHTGKVIAAGIGHRVRDRYRPMDVHPGDRVIYSARCDSFRSGEDGAIDVVDENSVLGVFTQEAPCL